MVDKKVLNMVEGYGTINVHFFILKSGQLEKIYKMIKGDLNKIYKL